MLPIAQSRDAIIESVKKFKTTIVVGETGSGKSTQLPQFLLTLLPPNGRLVCTQPRRVATISVAQRVAQERKCEVGGEVGYSIRFEERASSATRIKFVTDGVLLREFMGDKDLKQYDIVILDEAHERSLQTDILMGLLRQLQEKRPSLRIIVMSATLQTDLFMSYFQDTNLISISGRQYPVEVYYATEPVNDYVDAAMLTCMQIHASEEDGGVLVFLPGQDDIESLQTMLEDQLPLVRRTKRLSNKMQLDTSVVANMTLDSSGGGEEHNERITTFETELRPEIQPEANDNNKRKKKKKHSMSEVGSSIIEYQETAKTQIVSQSQSFAIYPLYAGMTPEDQMAAFKTPPFGTRKFILATNIAETSVTIAGIKYVVDCGFVKCRMLSGTTGVEMLKVIPISKAQANQRAGRSGRECPGKCFRLYPEPAFEQLELLSVPEIQRVGMAQVVLQLKQLGVVDPWSFPYLSAPSVDGMKSAMILLHQLGAFDEAMELTDHGRKMAALPLEPQYSHWLLKSKDFGCVSEVLTSVALLSTDNLMLHPHREAEKQAADLAHRRFATRDGDIPALNNIYAAWLQANKDKIWASRNFLSQRGLLHATSIRQQLSHLVSKLGIDTTLTCNLDKEAFLHCLAIGMCFNTARLVQGARIGGSAAISTHSMTVASKGSKAFARETNASASGLSIGGNDAPYVTLVSHKPVHIHPSSVLFAGSNSRNLPQFVVFSEILTTSKQYMRGVTAIEGSWLSAVPGFLKGTNAESKLPNQVKNVNKTTVPMTPSNRPGAVPTHLAKTMMLKNRADIGGAGVNGKLTLHEKLKSEPNATSFNDDDHLSKKKRKEC